MAILGLVGGAMAGGGAGGMHFGGQVAEYGMRSLLQQEMADIQKLRDAALHELRKGELKYADELRREPGKLAAKEIEEKTARPAYDEGADSVRPHTPAERAGIEEGAYRRQGLVQEAMSARNLEQQRSRDVDARIDREASGRRDDERLGLDRERLAESGRHAKVMEGLQRAQLRATTEGVVLQPLPDGRILKIGRNGESRGYLTDPATGAEIQGPKNIAETTKLLVEVNKAIIIANERRLQDAMLTPQEKGQIAAENMKLKGEIDALLGRKSDAPGPAQPTPEDIAGLKARAKDQRAVAFFESRYGQGSAAQFLREAPPPQAPASQVNPKRDQELRLRTNFGTLTTEADLKRALELGNPHAKVWLEIKKRRDEDAGRSSTGELLTPP